MRRCRLVTPHVSPPPSRSSTNDGLRELTSHFERKPKLVSLVLSAPPQVEKTGADEVAAGKEYFG